MSAALLFLSLCVQRKSAVVEIGRFLLLYYGKLSGCNGCSIIQKYNVIVHWQFFTEAWQQKK